MSKDYTPSYKQYGDLNKAEADYVRLEAEQIAARIVQQHAGKPFLLRLVGTIIEAHGKRLEPKPEPSSGTDLWTE